MYTIVSKQLCKYVYYITDDGSLSIDEFQAYFGDGILSNSQLQEIFKQIDTHNTK